MEQQQRFRPLTRRELRRAMRLPNRDELYGPIGTWDVSQVTDMSSMFRNDVSFNENINDWDVSRVTNMSSMFEGDRSFNQPLDNWNTSNVTDMQRMFSLATSFNQPLNNWNTSNVLYMSSMFERATSFNQAIHNWALVQVRDLAHMFDGATSMFNGLIPITEIRQPPRDQPPRDNTLQLPPLHQSEADRQRRQNFLEQQRQLRERSTTQLPPLYQRESGRQIHERTTPTMTQTSSNQFPSCCICQEPLNNRNGPAEEGSNDNDVIRVCDTNAKHFMHRGCAM